MTTDSAVIAPSAVRTSPGWVSRWKRSRAWQRFVRNRLAIIATVALLVIAVGVVLGPSAIPYSHDEGNLLESLEDPSLTHPLGTDANGRDVLVRLLVGGRISLTVGLFAVVIATVVGTLIGAISGFYGGAIDAVLMRCTEAMISLPTFFLVLAVLTVFPGNWAVPLVIGLTSWMSLARLVRGEFLRWKSVEFVEAAHVIGASDARIIIRHVLPQAMPTIIVSATLGIAHAILTESAISYLGLGVQPPTPTWGNMLSGAQEYLWNKPLLAVYPGMMIFLTVVCFNALGDGLRDALDPRRSDR